MDNLVRTGKIRTLLISISIIIVSLHTIYFYHVIRPELESKKLIQQAIRFGLTIALLVFVYKGKKWARNVSIVLFALAAIGAVAGIFVLEGDLFSRIPLIVMAIVYSIAVYHFGISKSFRAFFEMQKIKRDILIRRE